jgi:hypothetical protein
MDPRTQQLEDIIASLRLQVQSFSDGLAQKFAECMGLQRKVNELTQQLEAASKKDEPEVLPLKRNGTEKHREART